MQQLKDRLDKRQQLGSLRQLKLKSNLVDFASNDYLGLAKSEEFNLEIQNRWQKHARAGSGGSRLLTGNSCLAEELERRIAVFHGQHAGLLFGSGYMANVGLMTAVAQENDAIFYDSKVHASIRDGIRLTKAAAYPFRHNDLQHLEDRLKASKVNKYRYICIESIYSTDGSIAPLKEICRLSERHNAHIIIDEAHAVGVIGPQGKGLAAKLGLTDELFAMVVTFGKALGVYGAIVLGSSLLKQLLINFARPAIYSTALPFYCLAGIECSYTLFPKLDAERQHLLRLIAAYRLGSHEASGTHIQSMKIKGNFQALEFSHRLENNGIDARALLSPTVRRGEECLRICMHTYNTAKEVSSLLTSIQEFKNAYI